MPNQMDYSFKGGITPDAILAAFQRKAQLEEEMQMHNATLTQQKIENWQKVGEATSQAVSSIIAGVKQKQKQDFVNTLSDSLASQTIPNPMQASLFSKTGSTQQVPTAQYNPEASNAMRTAVQLNPQEATKRYFEQQFDKPHSPTPAFQSESILYNGQPMKAIFDPHSTNYYDPVTKQLLTGKIEPYSQQTVTELTDADRKRLTPLAKAVVEGRATPNALVNARGGEKEKLSLIASELDPSFDLSTAPQRAAIRKDFAPGGKSGQSISSLNTTIGHLDRMSQTGSEMNNTDLQLWNKVKNTAQRNTGNPNVDRMLADRDAATSELGRVFQTTGVVTEGERQEFRARLSEASSPEQIQAVADEWIKLLSSRMNTLQSNWKQTMGDNQSPTPFVNAKTKAILKKRGINPDTLEQLSETSKGSFASSIDYDAVQAELQKRGIK